MIGCGCINSRTGAVEISSGTARADGSTGELKISGISSQTYTWKSGDESTVPVYLNGGSLYVYDYSSSVLNGILKATSGTLRVTGGVLTLDENSSIDATNLTTHLGTGSTISIAGGTAYFDSSDNLYGNIGISSGSLTMSSSSSTYADLGGTLTISGGESILEHAVVESTTAISGGTSRVYDSNLNGDVTITGGNNIFQTGSDFGGSVDISGGSNIISTSTVEGSTSLSGGMTTFLDSTLENVDVTGGINKFEDTTLNDDYTQSDGTSTFTNSTISGSYTQSGGTSTIAGEMSFDSGDSVTGGTLNIGDGTTSSTLNFSGGTISSTPVINVNNNADLNISGGNVTLDSGDSWNGGVNLSGGSLALVGINKNSNAVYTQTGGSASVTGSTPLYLNNSSDSITGGTLDVGTDTTAGTVDVSKGTIASGATVSINELGTVNVKGGNVTLDSGDTWAGNVNVTSGTFTANEVTKSSSGTFTQSGGTTNLTGSLDLNNSSDSISGGTVNIGTETSTGKLTVSQGTIDENAQINIASYGSVNVKNSTVNLDSNDIWWGNIDQNGGTLNLNNVTKTGSFIQNNGTTNVTGKKLDLNNSSDSIDGGTLNIGDGAASSKLSVSKGTITENAAVNISDKGTLAVTGGDVTLSSDTEWSGKVDVTGGSLALVGITKSGSYTQSGGSTTVTGRNFALDNENDYVSGGSLKIGNDVSSSKLTVSEGAITDAASVDISKNATLDITGGDVELGSDTTWNGNVNISSGTLDLNSVTKNPIGSFTQTAGKTNIIGTGFDLGNSDDAITGGTLNIGNKVTTTSLDVSTGTIDSAATVNITKNATVNITGGDVELDSSDSWQGNVNITDGSLEINGIDKNSGGKFTQSGGTTTISNTEFDLNNENDSISGGKLNIEKSTLNVAEGSIESGAKVKLTSTSTLNVEGGSAALDNTDTWAGAVNVTSGTLTVDGVVDKTGTYNQKRGTTTVTGTGFDMNQATDSVTGGTLNIGDGTTVSDMSVSQGSISSSATVNIDSNGTLYVNGGTVALGQAGTWNGDVKVTDGTLTIDNRSKSSDGKFLQSAGTTTITDTGFDMNNASDTVSGGTLNIGDGALAGTLDVSKGSINQNASVVLNSNSTLNVTGGSVTLDGSTDTYSGTVNLSGGSLALVGISKNSSAVLKQSGGETTITGTNFDFNNSNDLIDGGTLNLGDGTASSTITVSKGTIAQSTKNNIVSGNTVNIKGGNVTLDGETDNFDGNVNISAGNLYLDSMNKNSTAVLTQTGGTTTVTGTGTVLNNESDTISSGNLTIGTSDTTGELNVENGTIDEKAAVTIAQGSSLNIKGGTTTLDGSNDKYNGDVNVSGGTLNLNSAFDKSTTSSSRFNQTGGTVNLNDAKLALNTSASKITGGTVNIAKSGELTVDNSSDNSSELNSTGGKLTLKSGSTYTITDGTVDEASTVNINSSGTLELNGNDVSVTLDGANDTPNGHIVLTDGTLNIKNGVDKTTTSTGTYNQTGGTANISGSKITLNEIGSIVSDGEVNVTDDSEFTVNNGKTHSSRINVSGSKFGIKNGSTYITKGGTIASDAEVTIASKAKLEIDGSDADVTLNGTNDNVSGSVELKNGTLYISDDLTKVTDGNGHYIQSGGSATLSSSSLTLADSDSKISGGDVNLTNNSTLTVAKSGGDITGGNITIDDTSVLNYLANKGLIQYSDGDAININTAGLINMVNDVRTNSSINNLVINNSDGSSADFAIDIRARSNSDNSADTITANSIQVANAGQTGTIRISDYNLGGDIFGYDAPIDKHIRLGKIFKTDELGSEVTFDANDKEVFTPIGYYKLNASSSNDGSYTFDLTRFNPQVFRGQVATAASYMNQLVINDTLFNRAQIRHYGASYGELFKNKTALIEGNTSFERTLKEGGLWTEVFGNFETLKMSHGLSKVRNNSWGFIVGGDFGLKELKNGWKWMPTAYIAYNGGHQTFNKVGLYENGGQLGFMSSFSKQNFMETALVYAGLYGTSMDIAGDSEDAFNYFAGLASKSCFDWNLGSHFKVQPNLTLAYNFFGKQSWHSDYGQMGMSAGFLNGFNVAPGVNFIWQQESWNLYATIAYAWNFFGSLDGTAGHVDLPDLKMKNGYLTWGFGMTKSFSDRLAMYGQATVRHIGRTGIICQGGVNWKL